MRIHESASVAGGLVRSATMGGVVYEPHGSHIFHTEDAEVWDYVQRFVPFNDYRHRVDILIEGKLLNWPMLVSDIDKQSDAELIKSELAEREGVDASCPRRLGQLRGLVPGADGPDALRTLHPPIYEEAVGARAASAERDLGSATGAAAPRQRPLSVPRPLPGLA